MSNKAIINLSGAIFLLTFIGMTMWRLWYTYSMPETPQPDVGRTIALRVFYSKIVYVTQKEKTGLQVAQGLVLVELVALYLIDRRLKSSDKKAPPIGPE